MRILIIKRHFTIFQTEFPNNYLSAGSNAGRLSENVILSTALPVEDKNSQKNFFPAIHVMMTDYLWCRANSHQYCLVRLALAFRQGYYIFDWLEPIGLFLWPIPYGEILEPITKRRQHIMLQNMIGIFAHRSVRPEVLETISSFAIHSSVVALEDRLNWRQQMLDRMQVICMSEYRKSGKIGESANVNVWIKAYW